ncbi:hypothetical protein AQUCO_01300230v1 [Aquilegia coerulea]|uniref:FBD domain-containing protein n=1 Tax=Aquilegia coerulea TaxID=218851 RepID=A0A2G5E0F3_AQUCA|nr:hypothetical protein AQUCO_01300230v1 [Aquilegia coerulea]
MLKHIKTIKIDSFGGSESEIKLLKFLLAQANSPVQIDITYVYSMREDAMARTRISEKLLTFTKTFPHAAIVFS